MPRLFPGALAAMVIALACPIAQATDWSVTSGRITLSLNESHLQDLGLRVVDVRRGIPSDVREVALEPPLYSFEATRGIDLRVRTTNGRVTSFDGQAIPFVGGLLFHTENAATGAAVSPLALFDFGLQIDPAASRHIAQLHTMDAFVPVPLKIESSGFALDAEKGQLRLRMGDLVLSREWAEHLGQPLLAGQWAGAVDVLLTLRADGPIRYEDLPREPNLAAEMDSVQVLDVKLGELYGITIQGHIGTYPTGVAGLAAATTSCNNGTVDVPWNAPMAQSHPFIGLALFREQGGVLEMLGQNWIKHGWFALANDQCFLGCDGIGGGSYLKVKCSDTYDAANNGERFFLGPREEVNPHTGAWTACGSYFDATPLDCLRDYFGTGHDPVEHRIEAKDADLGLPGATYLYEGAYFVADDDTVSNNIGWRECTMIWTGSTWSFDTLPLGSLDPNPGPVISTWGDMQTSGNVAPDDGIAWLAVKTTDLGGGQWHYEYGLYNRTSDRAFHSFSVPVGSANLSNLGFRDVDDSAATDWTSQVANGLITWSTDDFATDPNAPALKYQTMFNFRFDADASPVAAQGEGGLFKPGIGTSFHLATLAPAPGVTDAPVAALAADGLFLGAGEPNPFSTGTRVRFARATPGRARLSVLDVSGRVVRVLLDGDLPAGAHTAQWDGRGPDGKSVASGVYFFRLEAGDEIRTSKTTLLR